jgi:hypothetical protein
LALLLVLLSTGAPSTGAEVGASLASCADIILVGVVGSSSPARDESDGVITTRVEIRVTSIPRGLRGVDRVILEQLGGEVDGVLLEVSSHPSPRFEIGQTIVLLLDRTDGRIMARGLVQGRDRIEGFGLLSGRFELAGGADDRAELVCASPGPRLWLADDSPGLRELLGLPDSSAPELAVYLSSLGGPAVPCPGGSK